jgi:flagellar basal body-associated protein FliL
MSKAHLYAPCKAVRNAGTVLRFSMMAAVSLAILWTAGCQKARGSSEQSRGLTTLHLESFVVNLVDNDGRSFFRVGIDLGIEGQDPKAKIEQPTTPVPVIRDAVISLLSTLKADDLLTVDGKKKLKQDLVHVLNERAPELKVREVYFNEFMVQR